MYVAHTVKDRLRELRQCFLKLNVVCIVRYG